MKAICVFNGNVPVTPDMIETGGDHWWDSFKHSETEVSAKLFVRACQKAGEWQVTQDQLNAEDSSGRYIFNRLIGGYTTYGARGATHYSDQEYIEETAPGIFLPTEKFVALVFGKFAKATNKPCQEIKEDLAQAPSPSIPGSKCTCGAGHVKDATHTSWCDAVEG